MAMTTAGAAHQMIVASWGLAEAVAEVCSDRKHNNDLSTTIPWK